MPLQLVCGQLLWFECLSRVRGNSQARFLGGESLRGPTYPNSATRSSLKQCGEIPLPSTIRVSLP